MRAGHMQAGAVLPCLPLVNCLLFEVHTSISVGVQRTSNACMQDKCKQVLPVAYPPLADPHDEVQMSIKGGALDSTITAASGAMHGGGDAMSQRRK